MKTKNQDFPGGAVENNSPADAGDTGSVLGLRRFYMPQCNQVCVPQLLSLHATATKACAQQQKKLPQWEAHALQQRVARTHHN